MLQMAKKARELIDRADCPRDAKVFLRFVYQGSLSSRRRFMNPKMGNVY
jgi:hypothetical protein